MGFDGSEPSKQALQRAIEQARPTGASVDAVSAWEYPVGYGWGPVVDPEGLIKATEQVLSETVGEVAGDD